MSKPSKKLFISYAHGDIDYFEIFKKGINSHLFTSNKYDFGTWEDSKIYLGSFWDEVIKKNLSNSEVAILCVSANFLNSKYIEANEFSILINQFPNTLIIPVYFNHCNIHSWNELSKRQFFMPSGEKYDKATKTDFAFCDLVKFRETDGNAIPNSNIELYFKDLVRRIEDGLTAKYSTSQFEEKINGDHIRKSYSIVPKPTNNFTGREAELKSFAELFNNANIFCIEGLGGIGKSEFVSKFIERYSRERVVWLDSKNDSTFESLIETSGYLSLLKIETNDKLAVFLGFKDLIERDQKIIVIDNFQDLKDERIEDFFKFLKNSLSKAKFILLDRKRYLIEDIDVTHFLLEGLNKDSLEFAQKIIIRNYPNLSAINLQRLQKICDDLLGHPFAIQLSLQLLSYENDTENIISIIKEYNKESEKLSNRLLDEIFKHPKSTEDEKDILREFSVFRGKVQKEAFEFLSIISYKDPLKGLIDKLMISTSEGRYIAHPLVREFSYLKLINKKEAHNSALKYYLSISENNSDLEVQEEIFYHIQRSEQFEFGVNYFETNSEKLISYGFYKYVKSSIEYLFDKNYRSQKLVITLTDIGLILGASGRESLIRIREAFSLEKQNEEIYLEAKITEAEVLRNLGEIEEPIKIFEDLRKECIKVGFKKGESVCLCNVAQCLLVSEDFDLANTKAWDAYRLVKDANYYAGLQFAVGNLADSYYCKEKYQTAREWYDKMLANAVAIGNFKDIGIAKIGIANIHSSKGEHSKALDIYFESVKHSIEIGDKGNEAVNYYNIAYVLHELKDSTAIDYLSKSFELSKSLNDFLGLSRCLNMQGSWCLEDSEKSLDYFVRSIGYANKVKKNKEGSMSSLLQLKKNLGLDKYSTLLKKSFQNLEIEIKKEIKIEDLLFQPVTVEKRQGRNQLCACGSGKKFKNCHGQND